MVKKVSATKELRGNTQQDLWVIWFTVLYGTTSFFPSFFFLKEISIAKTVIKLRGFFYHLNLPSASKAFSSPGLSRPSHFLMESPGDNVDKPFKFPAFFYA